MNSIERVKEYFDIEQEAPAIIEDTRVNENVRITIVVKLFVDHSMCI
jgi:hypothetical protein